MEKEIDGVVYSLQTAERARNEINNLPHLPKPHGAAEGDSLYTPHMDKRPMNDGFLTDGCFSPMVAVGKQFGMKAAMKYLGARRAFV